MLALVGEGSGTISSAREFKAAKANEKQQQHWPASPYRCLGVSLSHH